MVISTNFSYELNICTQNRIHKKNIGTNTRYFFFFIGELKESQPNCKYFGTEILIQNNAFVYTICKNAVPTENVFSAYQSAKQRKCLIKYCFIYFEVSLLSMRAVCLNIAFKS